MAWTPKILSDFEIGQALAAIEAVARLGKPAAEVGSRRGEKSDLEHDLRACLQETRDGKRVQVWIRKSGDRWRYGFYAEPWVIQALDFLDDANVSPSDRHWISGLLFGYQATAIQAFIDSTRVADRDRASA